MSICTVMECGKPAQARGLCNTHYSRAWRRANPEQALAQNRLWSAKREECRERATRWRKRNPGKVRAKKAKRRAQKLNATPSWANTSKIREIYANCPKGMHVDHFIPLRGENVCGLHVEYNLQYLTPFENLSKGNKV